MIVIIGAGLAGLSAAIEAADLGAQQVLILDKENHVGGNSAKACSGINGIFTKAQKQANVQDSEEEFYNDTINSGHGAADPGLVKELVQLSTSAVQFLELHQVNLDVISQCGGHGKARTHRAKAGEKVSNVGRDIMLALEQMLKSAKYNKQVQIQLNAKVTKLLTSKDDADQITVTGVVYQDLQTKQEVQVNAVKALILASGGFAADRQLLAQYGGEKLAHLPTTNGAFSTGDGIKLVQQAIPDIQLVDMGEIQVHPTCFVNPDDPQAKTLFLAAEALRAHGGILVNQQGKRFTNELSHRDKVSHDIFEHCKSEVANGPVTAYLLLNKEMAHEFGEQLLSFYISKKFVQFYNSATEFANTIAGMTALEQTMNEYSLAIETKKADAFGKTASLHSIKPEQALYVLRITPGLHYTMGGIKIDGKARVLRSNNQIVSNLFAAGEVSGGVHGKNRLAGNSLLECVVFGRIAAQTIVKQ